MVMVALCVTEGASHAYVYAQGQTGEGEAVETEGKRHGNFPLLKKILEN